MERKYVNYMDKKNESNDADKLKTGVRYFDTYLKDGHYYGSLRVAVEEQDGYYEYVIPKIDLGIDKDNPLIDVNEFTDVIGIGGYVYKMLPGECGYKISNSNDNIVLFNGAGIRRRSDRKLEPIIGLYDKILIKEKVRKMTKEEIEKELGYKIEIVSK